MQLIIALDGMDETTALGWADAWDPTWCALKVGNESFTRFGPSFVRALAGVGINKPLLQQVKNLAELAKQANLDGVVCSALEVPELKAVCGQNFLTVTPGIRLEGDATHDQVRCVTPELATELGSDYGVIGRSITRAMNPTERLRQLVNKI